MQTQAQIERFGRPYVASSQVGRHVMRRQYRKKLLQGVVQVLVNPESSR